MIKKHNQDVIIHPFLKKVNEPMRTLNVSDIQRASDLLAKRIIKTKDKGRKATLRMIKFELDSLVNSL